MNTTLALITAAHHVQQPAAADVPQGLLGAAIVCAVVFFALWVLSRLAKALAGGSGR